MTNPVQQLREALVDQMLAARTPSEVTAAQAAAERWLRRHPDDDDVRFAGEQLALMADALGARHSH